MSYKEENEMLERIKEVEKTLNFQIANVTTPINDTINQMTTKLDLLTSKICLTSTKNLESFFLNRNLLTAESKLEINLYYQNIFISNFLNFDSLATILLQFKKEENEKLLNNVLISNRKGYKTNDYNAIYKVETINFVSNEFIKIKEQILNDLNSQLKKEYRLYGIITDLEELKDDSISVNFSNSVFIKNKTYKILYKKSKITDNLDIRYSVEVLNDRLNSNNNKYPFCYFFIFEGNKITPEYDENEFLVVKIDKDKSTSDGFLKDIAEKINSQNNAFLLSIINDLNGFFLVFKIDYSADDFNDEDSNY